MAAILAQGTLLKAGDGASPEVFTTITMVTKLTNPSSKFDLLDVTSHDDSGPPFYKQFLVALFDGNVLTFEVNWRTGDDTHNDLQEDNAAGTLRNFKVVFPDTPTNTASFAAYVEEFPNITADVGKPLTATGRLKIVGAIGWS